MGYEVERFQQQELLEEFICPICQDVLKDPVLIENCQHIFCSECINEWFQTSDENVCPNDRQPISDCTLRSPDRPFCNILKNLTIKCDFYLNGCEEGIKLDQLSVHTDSCLFNPKLQNEEVKCSTCGGTTLRKRMKNHNCVDHLKKLIEVKTERLFELENENAILETKLEKTNDCLLHLQDQHFQLQEQYDKLKEKLVKRTYPRRKSHSVGSHLSFESVDEEPNKDKCPVALDLIDISQIESYSPPICEVNLPRSPDEELFSSLVSIETSENNRKFVDNLCSKGLLLKPRVIEAMLRVDRGRFIQKCVGQSISADTCYILNHVRSIGFGAHIGPATFEVRLLSFIECHLPQSQRYSDEVFKILDVGCGSGYLTACIAAMANDFSKIYAIDHIYQLVEAAQSTFKESCRDGKNGDNRVEFAVADGRFGYEAKAPYDFIFIEGLIKRIPNKLLDQLSPEGKMIVIIGSRSKDISVELVSKSPVGEVTRSVLCEDWKIRDYGIDLLDEKKSQNRSEWKSKFGF